MKRYSVLGLLSIVALSVVVVYTHSIKAAETQQRASQLKPTESVLRLSGTPPIERRYLGPPVKDPPASMSSSLDANRKLVKARLTDEKLKLCETKSKNIQKRSRQMEELVVRMQAKLTSIVDGVKVYYLRKGFSLANYAELSAAISAKELALNSTLVTAQADMTGFACTGENPAEQVKKYHTDMQYVLTALEDYRKSIKDLIVAIQGISVTNVPSVSPTSSL